MEREKAYQENPEFWAKKEFKVVGDWIGRAKAIELLGDIKKKTVLETGCAAGFVARWLASLGAKVYGCEREAEVLSRAIEEEKKNPMGIEYVLSDITKLPYRENSFDKILCTGVLIHDDPKQVQNFVSEASRVLRPKGDIVVSITHPYLYEPVSPARTGKAKWLALRSKENRPLSESQQFEEDYLDKDGEKFESVVWHHPREFLLDTIKNSGLEIEQTQDVYITSDVVHKSPYWGDEINYPVFWQIKAIKPKNQ